MMYPKEKYIQLKPMAVLIIFILVILFFLMKRYYSEYSMKQKLTAGMIVNTKNELRTMSINVMFAAAKSDAKLPRDINSLINFLSTNLYDWERMRNEELRNFLASEKEVFCVINKKLYKDLNDLEKISHIVDQEGGKLIITNYRRILPDQK